MYLSLSQVGKYQSSTTDGFIYPCLSIPSENTFQVYEDEPVVQTREYFPTSRRRDDESSSVQTTTKQRDESVIPTFTPKPLLPVLDCRFNLREICKQSVLLEDHLTHDEKRCSDCCMKHFLALEGLCEEALTLDKSGEIMDEYRDLPEQIRNIQKLWLDDPHKNAHKCSQLLREIRKTFQPKVFSVIFSSPPPTSSCSANGCSIMSQNNRTNIL